MGAPELIAEIAASSASYELHDKSGMDRPLAAPAVAVGSGLNRKPEARAAWCVTPQRTPPACG
jgi:hypothetical protein